MSLYAKTNTQEGTGVKLYIKSYCEWMLNNRVKISIYLHLTDKEEVQNRK